MIGCGEWLRVNGFVDLHVEFGGADPPTAQRFGNKWTELTCAAGPVRIWSAESDGRQPLLHAEVPGWRVWATGRVFSYRGDRVAPLDRFAADLAQGVEEPAMLDAHAVLVALHGESNRVSVWTDRMGTVHAYQAATADGTAVGTYFGAVSEHARPKLDWVGITGFCGFGFYPADRTALSDVRIIRPATRVVFDRDGAILEQERYWQWSYEPDRSRSDDELVDEFHDIWTRTIRTQLRDTRSVVPISGGLDSRTVFAAATPLNRPAEDPVRTFTYGYTAKSPEIRISRRVAAARGHTAVELVVEPYLLDRLSEVDDAVEGFQALSFSRQAGVSREIAALGDHVVGGHWGDVWFDTAGAPTTSPTDLAVSAYRKFAKRGREWLLENVCRPNLDGEDPEDVLRDVLASEVARIPDLGDPDMRLKTLKTEQWSFRWTLASVRAYQLAVPTLLPFYANEVVDYFLRVPTDRLPGRRLQIAYLKRHHPDLARITWQDSGMSLFERPWEPAVALGRRAVAKGLRTLRRERAIERNWEVQYFGGDRPKQIQDLLRRTGSGTADAPPGEVQRFVNTLLAGPDSGGGYALDSLLTLATLGMPLW